jgi:hypothetical protein
MIWLVAAAGTAFGVFILLRKGEHVYTQTADAEILDLVTL